MGKRTRGPALPTLGLLFIAGGFYAATAAAQPAINVGNATGGQGQKVPFSVTLSTGGVAVAGTQNDISFAVTDDKTPIGVGQAGYCAITTTQTCSADSGCPIQPPPFSHEPCVNEACVSGHCAVTTTQTCTTAADCGLHCAVTIAQTGCTVDTDCPEVHEPCIPAGGPDCSVNSALGKGGFFSFLPQICSGGSNAGNQCTVNSDCPGGSCGQCSGATCTGIRALILAVNNLAAIPDGSTLYTCNVSIASDAALGDHTLAISNMRAGDTSQAPINEACVSGHCSVTTTKTCTTLADCPSIVTGTDGTITVTPGGGTPILVCDVFPSTGNDASQFGNGSILNNDVVAIFKASLLGPPPAGSARFVAMDSIAVDSPPTCGGSGSILNNDVVACFKRSLLGGPNFVRTLSDATCTSAPQ